MTRGGILEGGTELAGYRIRSLLAEGGMGVVYLATQVRLDREVALKVIAPERNTDPEFQQRFIRESQLAASLDHPNVLPVYDAGEADGEIYLAMRYVDGGDLRGLLKEQGRLPAALAIDIARQIALALGAAHTAGLVHRDVKPANILLDGNNHAYLSDFGLARSEATSGLTRTGIFLGTPDYSSPEQLEGVRALDGRADVYSLACVLYHCLVGQPPFVRESEVRVITAHLHDPAPQLSQLRPDLPAKLSQTLDKAMAKNRAERYASASDFADALTAVLAELDGDNEQQDASMTTATALPIKGKTVLDQVAAQLPLRPQAEEPRNGRLSRGARLTRERLEVAHRFALGVSWRSRTEVLVALGAIGVVGAAIAAIVLSSGSDRPPVASSTPSGSTLPRRVAIVRASDNSRGAGYGGAVKLAFTIAASGRLPVTRIDWRAISAHPAAERSGRLELPSNPAAEPTRISGLATGLSNGVKYSFMVRPCNRYGCARWSRSSNTVTPFSRPLPPTASARSVGGTTIVFGWSGGGSRGRPVAHYQISIDGGPWKSVGAHAGHVARSYGYAARHDVRARVVDSSGQVSPASRVASAKTAPAPIRPSPVQPAQTQTVVNQ